MADSHYALPHSLTKSAAKMEQKLRWPMADNLYALPHLLAKSAAKMEQKLSPLWPNQAEPDVEVEDIDF